MVQDAEDPGRPRDDSGQAPAAEEMLEQWSRRAGRFLVSAAARVREQAEDLWADAQSVKRGERD